MSAIKKIYSGSGMGGEQHVDGDRVNILLVDDLPEKIMSYESILEELGQNIIIAHSGEEALKLVLQQEFAVILLDVNMPGMDGFETASLIRSRKRSSHTPIIFLTAFPDEMRMAQGYASGAVDYLPTPVVPEILKAKIRVFIELSQMRRQAASQAEEKAMRKAAEDSARKFESMANENSRLLERIQEGEKRKDEFLATLAHELRNPLAPIRNSLQVMKMSKDPALRQQSEDIIERQLRQMIHLVDDLMDISRITQGKIELRKDKILLNDVLKHATETAEPLIKQRGHSLTVHLPEEPVWLDADFSRISQIFSNLLNNAAKYTDNNGRIELTTEHEGDWVTITVADNGIGIPDDMVLKIFEMFSQVDSSLERTQGGLGIGLTLVKSLVEMHGGNVQVQSGGLQKGSKFMVKLPTTTQKPVVHEPHKLQKEDSKKSLRVLVVDDNEALAKTLGWMVELSGHEIRVAHDGRSAIEIAQIYNPSVVLLDIGLPGMNGYEVCKEMHKHPSLKNTIYVAHTGWGQEDHRRRSKEAGFDHHLVKPVELQELQELLAQL